MLNRPLATQVNFLAVVKTELEFAVQLDLLIRAFTSIQASKVVAIRCSQPGNEDLITGSAETGAGGCMRS